MKHLNPATVLAGGFSAAAPARPLDQIVAEVIHRLEPLGSLSLCRSSRLALVLYRRCKKIGEPLVTAGQIRAARANKKMGRHVADSESTTFAQALAQRTGMHPKRARRLVSAGTLGASILRKLEHTAGDTQRNLEAMLRLDPAYRIGKPEAPAVPSASDWWELVPEFKKTKTLFHLPGVVTLHCGDSEQVLADYPDESFDGAVTDQPFGVGYNSSKGERVVGDGKVQDTSRWMVSALQRVTRANTFVILHGQEPVSHAWQVEMAGGGFRKVDDLVWDKVIASVRGSTVRRRHELIYLFAKGHPLRPKSWTDHWGITGAEPGTRITKDDSIWRHAKPVDSKHPTAKPPELHQRQLLNYFPVGSLIVDPCCGTGPVAVAALRTGHRLVGVEKVRRYYRIAIARVEAELRNPETSARWMSNPNRSDSADTLSATSLDRSDTVE